MDIAAWLRGLGLEQLLSLAARLQALAGPNTLIIGEAPGGIIGRLFDLKDLGTQRLDGAEHRRPHPTTPSPAFARRWPLAPVHDCVPGGTRAAGNDGATERFLSRFLDHLHDTDSAARGLAPLHYLDMNIPRPAARPKASGLT